MIDFIGLELIQFHDVPLKSISIQNELSHKLILEIMLWDENMDDYVHNTLIFGELNHISPERISIEENSELEIYSFDYRIENLLFFGKLTCLTGFGNPSFEIDFSCKTVEIKEIKTESNKT